VVLDDNDSDQLVLRSTLGCLLHGLVPVRTMERCGGAPDSIRYRLIRALDSKRRAKYHPAMRLTGIRTCEALMGRTWSFVN
jgi:hypothetical protein